VIRNMFVSDGKRSELSSNNNNNNNNHSSNGINQTKALCLEIPPAAETMVP
jgi:hypothetical protein